MPYLIATILLHVLIFIAFRSFSQYKMNTFQAVVSNYLVCVVTGSLLISNGGGQAFSGVSLSTDWLPLAGLLGAMFVSTFYLMAMATQRLGMGIASIASQMSLIIPVMFSLFIFQINTERFTALNYAGIALALVAIFLATMQKGGNASRAGGLTLVLMPISIFFMNGLITTFINYINLNFLSQAEEALFPIFAFGAAAIIGSVVIAVSRQRISLKSILGGIYLGIPNYFSIYFLLRALSAFDNNGAFLYPIFNIGVILGSSLAGLLLYRERLGRTNLLGLLLAIIALAMLAF